MPFLIDGYNLYHVMCKFDPEFSRITPATMCRYIAQDMLRLRDRAVVVFDGRARPGFSTRQGPDRPLRIIFSGPDSDADTYLERLIQESSAPRRLLVVSSDLRLRKAARRRRAQSLRAHEYLQALLKRRSRPRRSAGEPPAKRRGLAAGQADEWLKLFGLPPVRPGEPPTLPER